LSACLHFRRLIIGSVLSILLGVMCASTAAAQETLCDNAFEDCRTPILALIRNETVGIDVSYWFMNDTRYRDEIIKAWRDRKVPVRILLDLRADTNYPSAKLVRDSFVAAGIPIRYKFTTGINHWKMILYAGQGKVHFSAANFANGSYSPIVPYHEFVDEVIYFTDDPAIVNSFLTRYDDLWTDTTDYADFANITGPLVRTYQTFPIHSDLNFPPDQDYQDRAVAQMKLETQQIDVAIFRITSAKLPDEVIRRAQAGVRVRLITEPNQYRNPTYLWHSYNVDRMYMAGVPILHNNKTSDQDMHQKSIVLYSRAMAIFGSSNWTSSSSDIQREHNYFTKKPWMVQWFKDQFERKWNNRMAEGDGGGPVEPPVYVPFVPLAPDAPQISSPVSGALGIGTSVTLSWEGGYWAHKYDIYFGTTSPPPLVVEDYMPGSATAGISSKKESYIFSSLTPGTTYYWKIVSKTMANMTKNGTTWNFTTSGGVPPPPTPGGLLGTAISPTSIALIWNNVSGEQGYKVERKLASATTWTQTGTTAADAASYVDSSSGLTAGTSYNYRVRAYTTGGNSAYSNTVTVTTPFPQLSGRDIVLWAAEAPLKVGDWSVVNDTSAAGGKRLENANAGAIRNNAPLANPIRYFEMSFNALAGLPYRLWVRGKASNNNEYNDSVYVQFSGAVDGTLAPVYRIGTTAGAMVNLEDCSGCGLNGWGWQDDAFGPDIPGSDIYFDSTGVQTIQVQVREDGLSIDQIVLSPDTYLFIPPGGLKLDSTILGKQGGTDPPPPPIGLACLTSTGQVGVAYSSSLVATGGVAPYTYSIVSGGLAAGLTLNPSTGAISGTPTTAGTDTFTAQVVDSRGTAEGTTTSSCNSVTITPPPSPPGSTVTIAEDAYVRAGSYESTNYGSAPDLIAKFSADTKYARETYLKLDVSAVTATNTVALRLFGFLSDTRALSVTTTVYGSDNVGWSESTLTWTTRPSVDPIVLGTIAVSGTTPQWYQVDLTAYVQTQISLGVTSVTIALKSLVDTLPYVGFNSTEALTGKPYVVLADVP